MARKIITRELRTCDACGIQAEWSAKADGAFGGWATLQQEHNDWQQIDLCGSCAHEIRRTLTDIGGKSRDD